MIRHLYHNGALGPKTSKDTNTKRPQDSQPEEGKTTAARAASKVDKDYAPATKRVKLAHEFVAEALDRPSKLEKNLVPSAIRRTAYASSVEALRARWSADYFDFKKPLIYLTNPSKKFFIPSSIFYKHFINNQYFQNQNLVNFYDSLVIAFIEPKQPQPIEIGSIRQMNEDSPNFHKLYALMRIPGGHNKDIVNEDQQNHLTTAEYCFRMGIIVPQNETLADALLAGETSFGASSALHQAILDDDIAMMHYLLNKGASLFNEHPDDNLTSFDRVLKSDRQGLFNDILERVNSKEDLASLALVLKYESDTLNASQKTSLSTKLAKI